ncbi:Exportin-T [Porphyridium purpureum]|uniref:Exportin-T n=1 Tax=Porphyridium purpureum TaxID=35688 RepID=A0A5J4YTW1_PORPP|nr:Exportin-T [Porphyridium purpureum]|eukprot:POR1170..scf227_4
MDDFEAAVLLALNPAADRALVGQAVRYTDAVRVSPEGWRFCLEKLMQPYQAATKFWCLGVLAERYVASSARRHEAHTAAASKDHPNAAADLVRSGSSTAPPICIVSDDVIQPQDRALFRQACLMYLAFLTEREASAPSFLKNKLAQLIALVVRYDYPHEWPNVFFELIQFVENGPGALATRVELFFRIMRGVDEEVTSLSAFQQNKHHSMTVREGLRSSAIIGLTNIWHGCIRTDEQANERFAVWALDTLKRYSEWIDITLVLQDSTIGFISSMLGAERMGRYNKIHASCASALSAIVSKRMGVEDKMNLLERLQVLDLLRDMITDKALLEESGTHEESELGLRSARVEIAAVVNKLASEALEGMKVLLDDIRPVHIVRAALMVAIRLLSGEDGEQEVLEESVALISSYVLICKRDVAAVSGSGPGAQNGRGPERPGINLAQGQLDKFSDDDGLRQISVVTMENMRFPDNYDPAASEDDDLTGFATLRKLLLKVFRNIAVVAPNSIFAATQDMIRRVLREPSPAPADMELVFTLVQNLYELMPDKPAAQELVLGILSAQQFSQSIVMRSTSKALGNSSSFAGPAAAVSSSAGPPTSTDASRDHQMASVALMYLELATRAHRLLQEEQNTATLLLVLETFFGERGLRSRDGYTRSRSAHLLVKFVRTLRFVISSKALDAVLNTITPLLAIEDSSFLSVEDEYSLFEACGLVLGAADIAGVTSGSGDEQNARMAMYLRALLTPLIAAMSAAGGSGQEALERGVHSLKAAGALSKGFVAYVPMSPTNSTPLHSPRLLDSSPSKSQPFQRSQQGQQSADGGASSMNDSVADMQRTAAAKTLWLECLEAVMALRLRYPAHRELNKGVLFFYHRMVETAGADILRGFSESIAALLGGVSSPPDIMGVLLLVNQVVLKFQAQAAAVLDELFGPLVTVCVQYLPDVSMCAEPNAPQSEEERERIELVRAFVMLLFVVLESPLAPVMVSARNVRLLKDVTMFVLQTGHGNFLDGKATTMSTVRQTFQVVVAMSKLWITSTSPFARASGSGPGEVMIAAASTAPAVLKEVTELVLAHAAGMCVQCGQRLAMLISAQVVSAHAARSVVKEVVALEAALLESPPSIHTAFNDQLIRALSASVPGYSADTHKQYTALLLTSGREDDATRMLMAMILAERTAS